MTIMQEHIYLSLIPKQIQQLRPALADLGFGQEEGAAKGSSRQMSRQESDTLISSHWSGLEEPRGMASSASIGQGESGEKRRTLPIMGRPFSVHLRECSAPSQNMSRRRQGIPFKRVGPFPDPQSTTTFPDLLSLR